MGRSVKLGINDRNKGNIEGTVVGTPNMQDTGGGRKAFNFVIECRKHTSSGEKFFRHHVVAFNNIADMYAPYIKDGVFVNIEYHLIEQSIMVDGKKFEYSKPVADYIEVEE